MLKSGEPFAMAGIYARKATGYDTAEKNPLTFAIPTIKANDAVRHIHERMPVISWLPPDPSGMFTFLPFASELMTAYPVSPKMNKASFNTPEAIAALEPRYNYRCYERR
jgi:putative SOS response-associated peptidase YedK